MEKIIDAATYNRKNLKYQTEKEEKRNSKNTSIIVRETAISMAILAGVLICKVLDLKGYDVFEDKYIDNGMQYSEIKTEVVRAYGTAKNKANEILDKYLSDDNIDEIRELPKAYGHNELIDLSEIDYDISNGSGENKEEDIGETSKDLSDAEIVKSKFNMISPLKGVITSSFGHRDDDNPIVSANHKGLDIAANSGTAIVSAHEGKVIEAGLIRYIWKLCDDSKR